MHLMDSTSFNFKKLRTIDRKVIKKKIAGVNFSFIYIGTAMSAFNWHVEDRELYGLNIVLFGFAKVWDVIRPSDAYKFEQLLNKLAGPKLDDYKNCSNFSMD